MGKRAPEDHERRWPRRRLLARFVSALVYALPVGAAVGASYGVSRVLPPPGGAWVEAGDWAVVVVLSTAVLLSVDRLTRRLLPLAALLELSLLFPDHAPRRVAVARRAGSIRNLHDRIEEAKRNGVADEPAQAAVRIVELVGALHAHDRRTRGHSERVRALTEVLADQLRIGPADLDRLRWSALLHDIGKIHVSPRILNKPGQLHADEWDAIRRHPEEGARMAAPLEPWLGEWAQVIVQHHERWDGSGYPHGLREKEISYGARIVALADAYEVMTAARSYKMPMTVAAARRELTRYAGTQFDPMIVRAFLEVSIGRLRWIAGPMSWAAQLPFLGALRHTVFGTGVAGAQTLGQSVGQAAGVIGTAAGAVGVAVVAGALTVPSAPPAAAVTPPTPTVSLTMTHPPAGGGAVDPAPLAPVAPAGPAAAPGRSAPRAPVAGADPLPTGSQTHPADSDPPRAEPSAPDPHPAPPVVPPGRTVSATASNGRSASHPPRRRRVGWAAKGLGQLTGVQGGLGRMDGHGPGTEEP